MVASYLKLVVHMQMTHAHTDLLWVITCTHIQIAFDESLQLVSTNRQPFLKDVWRGWTQLLPQKVCKKYWVHVVIVVLHLLAKSSIDVYQLSQLCCSMKKIAFIIIQNMHTKLFIIMKYFSERKEQKQEWDDYTLLTPCVFPIIYTPCTPFLTSEVHATSSNTPCLSLWQTHACILKDWLVLCFLNEFFHSTRRVFFVLVNVFYRYSECVRRSSRAAGRLVAPTCRRTGLPAPTLSPWGSW